MFDILIPGLVGKLEVRYVHNDCEHCALILPPHPTQKKHYPELNFDSSIVDKIADSFHKENFSTLTINYRGMGRSEGTLSDAPEDILKDTNKAIHWLENTLPLTKELWIAGHSYGAWLSLNMLMRRPEITGFALVGLPIKKSFDYSFISPYHEGGIIIQSTNDPLAPNIADINKVFRSLSPAQSNMDDQIEYHKISSNYYQSDNQEDQEIIGKMISKYIKSRLSIDSVESVSEEECVAG